MSTALAKAQDVAAWTAEQGELIKRTCAKDATDDELQMYLHVAERSGLDPLRKQLHFLKVGGRVTFIADVNGLQARAAREPDFEGIDHAVVYEKDDFLFDQKTGEVVKHVNNPFNSGKPVGAWAIVRRKGKRPFVSCVRFSEYFNPNNPLWKEGQKPSVMIDKCAKSTALRLAYPEQFGGIYDRAELGKVEEKEINPLPPSGGGAPAPSNGTHAKDVARQLKAGAVVDVKPGETEAEAATRTAKEQAAKPPDESLQASMQLGLLAKQLAWTWDKMVSVIRGATGKQHVSQLLLSDVQKVKDAVAITMGPASRGEQPDPGPVGDDAGHDEMGVPL